MPVTDRRQSDLAEIEEVDENSRASATNKSDILSDKHDDSGFDFPDSRPSSKEVARPVVVEEIKS